MTRLLQPLQRLKTMMQQTAATSAATCCKALQRVLHQVLHQVLHTALPLKGEWLCAAEPLRCSRSRTDR